MVSPDSVTEASIGTTATAYAGGRKRRSADGQLPSAEGEVPGAALWATPWQVHYSLAGKPRKNSPNEAATASRSAAPETSPRSARETTMPVSNTTTAKSGPITSL